MSEFNLLKKYPIVVFVILAFLPMVLLLIITLPPEIPFEVFLVIGSWAPNIAAIIVLGLILNEKGVSAVCLQGGENGKSVSRGTWQPYHP